MARMPGPFTPGLTWPSLVTVAWTVPVPAREAPALLVTALAVKVLPLPTVSVPALVNGPAVEKLRPFRMVKLPPAPLVVKFARALAPLALTICAAGPSRITLAALVAMLAPGNWNVLLIR